MLVDLPLKGPRGTDFYWYPYWNNTKYATRNVSGKINRIILDIESLVDKFPTTCTFYPAITEHDTFSVLDMDSVSITIK